MAQTRINLQAQSKSVDFANADFTRPAKTGTTLPSACNAGEVFFKSNAPAGSNLYGCTATNTWSQMTGSGGGTGTLGGDVSGASSAATVVGIRSRAVSAAAPSNGQVLGWNGFTNVWEPQTPTSGQSSGGGQAVPFQTSYSSASTLSIGTGCSASNICMARFGSTSYQISAAATATISAGTGTAYVYINSMGSVVIGHSMTVSCAGCTAMSGVTSFPADSIPLYTWTANNGQWDANGGLDWRATISTKNITAGTGLVAASAGGATTMSVDTATVGLRVAPPASSASACTIGSWAADSSFFYVCQATNSWRRVAASTW